MDRTDRFVTIDGIEIHYSEWGDPGAEPVVCVHGLSRVGRDFDPIARRLADDYRVLCPDMPGRGLSGWADDPATAYTNEAMAGVLVGFCDELGLDRLRWIGTSMGGVLGIALAAGPLAERVTHLVVNDVSPDPAADADEAALERIATYVGDPPAFDTVTGLEAYYREIYEPFFSPMTDGEWRRFTVTAARRTDDGRVAPGYDPRIVEALDAEGEADADPWATWEAIDADVLVLHGVDSTVLPRETFEEMLDRRPDAEAVEVDCGHAPALNVDDQIDPVVGFLAG